MDVHQNTICIDAESTETDDHAVELPMEVTNTTGTYLVHLNEDCLLAIFSKFSFLPMDLCALAETCKQFKRIAQRIFPKAFKIKVNATTIHFESKKVIKIVSEQDLERILKNFGQYLTSLTVRRYERIISRAVEKYCNDGALKRFTFRSMPGRKVKHTVEMMKTVFQRLRVLSFWGSSKSMHLRYLRLNCESLIELRIGATQACSEILKNTFPILKRFTFKEYAKDEMDALFMFIKRHKFLRSLVLDVSAKYFNGDFTHSIGSCKELEELTIGDFRPDILRDCSKLYGLKKLRVLNIGIGLSNYSPLAAFLQPLQSLEVLDISYMIEDPVKVVNVLSRLQHLRALYLKDCSHDRFKWRNLAQLTKIRITQSINTINAIDIVSSIPNLEQLEFCGSVENLILHEKEFREIVKCVERRPGVLTLTCSFGFDENRLKNCNKNGKVKLIKWK